MPAKLFPCYFWKISYWQQWFRVSSTHNHVATLNPRQIYIVPTRWGFLYAVMLIALLVGSINYSLSLGYYVTFLLTSLGNIGMLHTWRNLVHLQLAVMHAEPVFAGDVAQVTIKISDIKNRARYAIMAGFKDNEMTANDIVANHSQQFLLPLNTKNRGWITIPRITLYTEFPLSLLHTWALVDNPFKLLVYPKPIDNNSLAPLSTDAGATGTNQFNKGDDDFVGHKNYQLGDSPSRVDWKASSRGIGMLSKQYSGAGASTLWLDWAQTEGGVEARIAQLTRWVIDAHESQQIFGLKLPQMILAPDNSHVHYHQALSALALYE